MYLDKGVNALGKSVLYVDDRQYSAVLINPNRLEELLNLLQRNPVEYKAHLDIPINEPTPPFPLVPPTSPTYEWPRKGPSKKRKPRKIPPPKTPPPGEPQNNSMEIYQGRNYSLVSISN